MRNNEDKGTSLSVDADPRIRENTSCILWCIIFLERLHTHPRISTLLHNRADK